MRQHEKTLEELKITVIPISFQYPPADNQGTAAGPPPVDYFLDLDKTLYHHYSMFSAGFWDLWGPATWIAYLKLLLRGQKLSRSDGDVEQRGGDVLIDPGGIIRLHHIGSGPGDRPDVSNVLAMVKRAGNE